MFNEIRKICHEAKAAVANAKKATKNVNIEKDFAPAQKDAIKTAFENLNTSQQALKNYRTSFFRRIFCRIFGGAIVKRVNDAIKHLNPFNKKAVEKKNEEPARPAPVDPALSMAIIVKPAQTLPAAAPAAPAPAAKDKVETPEEKKDEAPVQAKDEAPAAPVEKKEDAPAKEEVPAAPVEKQEDAPAKEEVPAAPVEKQEEPAVQEKEIPADNKENVPADLKEPSQQKKTIKREEFNDLNPNHPKKMGPIDRLINFFKN